MELPGIVTRHRKYRFISYSKLVCHLGDAFANLYRKFQRFRRSDFRYLHGARPSILLAQPCDGVSEIPESLPIRMPYVDGEKRLGGNDRRHVG